MKNTTVGVILLSVAGLVAAVGTVGAQLSASIVLAAFHLAKMGGINPPSPSDVSPHWLVSVSVAILASSGLFFLFSRNKVD
jgi:hypothetical protein